MGNNRGFTLIEVLASIVILGIITTGLFQYFIFSQKTTTNNQDKLVAINVAQNELEKIKEQANKPACTAIDCTYWEITHPGDHILIRPIPDYKETVNGTIYTINIVITAEKTESNLYMIAVSIVGDDKKRLSTVKGLVEL